MFKRTFTLVEILITLTILGIVAALTLPPLVSSYKKKVYATSLKKVYNQIVTSAQAVINDENGNETIFDENGDKLDITPGFYTTTAGMSDSTDITGARYFLKNYFKYIDIGTPTPPSSILPQSYTANGQDIGSLNTYFNCIKMPDNAVICMHSVNGILRVIVDINGKENPNATGLDVFVMNITNDGNLEDLSEEDNCNNIGEGANAIEQYASGCLNKVINAGWKIE